MDPTQRTTAIIVGLVVGGFALGWTFGSWGEDGGGSPQAVVETVTSERPATTKTVRRTRTVVRTVTVDEFGDALDPNGEDPDADDEFATDTTDGTDTTETSGSSTPCSSEYLGACVPDDGTASCPDIDEQDFESIGEDPYGLDPDGDGVACEV